MTGCSWYTLIDFFHPSLIFVHVDRYSTFDVPGFSWSRGRIGVPTLEKVQNEPSQPRVAL
jgi:hypothetical protein